MSTEAGRATPGEHVTARRPVRTNAPMRKRCTCQPGNIMTGARAHAPGGWRAPRKFHPRPWHRYRRNEEKKRSEPRWQDKISPTASTARTKAQQRCPSPNDVPLTFRSGSCRAAPRHSEACQLAWEEAASMLAWQGKQERRDRQWKEEGKGGGGKGRAAHSVLARSVVWRAECLW